MLASFDNYWDENKSSIASKSSIVLGILGGVGSVLIGLKMFIPASVVLGVVNIGIFFSGISIESIKNDNDKIKLDMEKKNDDIVSLNKEKQEIIRRYSTYNGLQRTIITNEPTDTPSSNGSEKSIEPVNFELMHYNNKLQDSNSFIFPNN